MAKWLLRGSFVLAALVLPTLLGTPAALAMWLLMPLMVECSREMDERWFCGAGIVLLACVCGATMHRDAFAAASLWGACGIGMLILPQKDAFKRSFIWTGLSAAVLCLALVWLGGRYPQGIFPGLAEDIANGIYRLPGSDSILLRCYQMGLARLEDDVIPAVNLFGLLLMSREVRMELLYSLRYTLEITLEAMVPQAIGAWLLLTLVLTTALPDLIRRRQGRQGVMPSFGEWRITPWAQKNLNAMVIVYFLTLLVDHPVAAQVGGLASAVFEYGYMIYGLAVMEGLGKRIGTARVIRRLWMLGCILFAPFVLILLGVADRFFDLRRLSQLTKNEGGYEQ